MSKVKDQVLIAQIVSDIETHAVFNPYADQIPDDLVAAYDIQDALVIALLASGVRKRVCGYKLALNSARLLTLFAIDEPVAGQVFLDQKWDSPANLRAADYRSLLIEPEIMAVLGADLSARPDGHNRASVLAAVERYLPSVELLDTRGSKLPDARLSSIVAQNVTTEGLVFGGPGLAPQDLDVDTLEVRLSFDGRQVAETSGSAPQHPLDAVSWLANHLNKRGAMLKRGDIVICGTHLPPRPVQDAHHVLVDMGVLGKVEFSLS